MKKAVFLDRDGVLNDEVGLLIDEGKIVLRPYVEKSLRELKSEGYLLFCVTNQPVIARGLIDEKGVERINGIINKLAGNHLDRFFVCPHHPRAALAEYRLECDCRKPSEGMLTRAAREFEVDLENSWMVGDRISDIIAGKRAGCRTVLIEADYSRNLISTHLTVDTNVQPNFSVKNIEEATQKILYGEKI